MILQEASIEDLSDSYMALAKSQSEQSSLRFKLGAVIKIGKKSRVSAYNVHKTHGKLGSGRYNSLHAETHAILKAKKQGMDLKGATLYVYREGGLNSKPCPDCQRIIKQHGIKKVIYTNGK